MRIPALVLALALALTTPLLAEVRFTMMAWEDSLMSQSFSFANGSQVEEVKELHTLKRSPVHVWKGEGTCLFSLDGQNPGTAAEPKLEPGQYVPVNFPDGGGDFLVMLQVDKGEPSGIRARVYDDSLEGFPWGSYRVMNGSGSPLLMKVGPDGPRVLLSRPALFRPRGTKRNIPVAIVAKADPGKLLYSSVWQHRPDQRRIVFVSRAGDARQGTLELKVVPERRREHDRQRSAEGRPSPSSADRQ